MYIHASLLPRHSRPSNAGTYVLTRQLFLFLECCFKYNQGKMIANKITWINIKAWFNSCCLQPWLSSSDDFSSLGCSPKIFPFAFLDLSRSTWRIAPSTIRQRATGCRNMPPEFCGSSRWWDLSEGRTWRTWRVCGERGENARVAKGCWRLAIFVESQNIKVMRISRYLRHFKALIGKQEHENPRYIATSFVWRWAKSWLENWLDLSSFFQIVDDLEC